MADRRWAVLRLPEPLHSPWRQYLFALASFTLSFLLRYDVNAWMPGDRGFILFVPAVILTTLFAGLLPGILTAQLSGVAIWYFFLPPFNSFALGPGSAVDLANYIVVISIIMALIQWLRASIDRIREERTGSEALARQQKLLVEAMPNGIVAVDSSGRIRLMNDRLATLFGYSRDELLGEPVEKLIPKQFRDNHAALRWEFSQHPVSREMGAGRDLYGLRKDGSEFPVEIGLSSFASDDNEMSLAVVIDITERKRAEEKEKLLVSELQHRTKNLFAVVHALAHRTFRDDTTLDDARSAFLGRLSALARADQRLTSSQWQGTSLNTVVSSELEPFGGRVKIEGNDLMLDPQVAQNFALAIHELATNASKYGALSGSDGTVTIGWTVSANNGGGLLKFFWRERGGPLVRPPQKYGFGASLLNATFVGGRTEYAAEGITYEVDVPLAQYRREAARAD